MDLFFFLNLELTNTVSTKEINKFLNRKMGLLQTPWYSEDYAHRHPRCTHCKLKYSLVYETFF